MNPCIAQIITYCELDTLIECGAKQLWRKKALRSSCELLRQRNMELHASLCNFVCAGSWNLIELYASSLVTVGNLGIALWLLELLTEPKKIFFSYSSITKEVGPFNFDKSIFYWRSSITCWGKITEEWTTSKTDWFLMRWSAALSLFFANWLQLKFWSGKASVTQGKDTRLTIWRFKQKVAKFKVVLKIAFFSRDTSLAENVSDCISLLFQKLEESHDYLMVSHSLASYWSQYWPLIGQGVVIWIL